MSAYLNDITQRATLTYSGIKIVLDGKAITPKDANGTVDNPFVIDGTTYMPVRALSNALGMNVDWDGSTNTVLVTNPGSGNAAANVKLSLSKPVYAPGDTITVKYSGVTSELIANGTWIGMAGANNAASEHLSSGDYVRHESGTVTLKAPSAAGSYQVRFFKAQGATADNYVSSASTAFTVVVRTNTVSYPEFSVHMYVINEQDGKGSGDTNHSDASVTAKDGKIEVEIDAISFTSHADTTMTVRSAATVSIVGVRRV